MEEKKIEEEVTEEVEEEQAAETPEEPVEEDVEVEVEPEPEEEKCECYSVDPPKQPWRSTFAFGTYQCKLCGRRMKK